MNEQDYVKGNAWIADCGLAI